MSFLKEKDPEIFRIINREIIRQEIIEEEFTKDLLLILHVFVILLLIFLLF